MAYTDIPSTDVDVDSPLDTDLFTALRDNDNSIRENLVGVDIAETSTASASYVTLTSFDIYVPSLDDYTGIQRSLVFEFEAKITGGGTATYKVTDNGAAVDSDEATETASSYASNSVTVNFAAGVKGTVRQIDVKAKASGGGTAFLKVVNRITSRLNY